MQNACIMSIPTQRVLWASMTCFTHRKEGDYFVHIFKDLWPLRTERCIQGVEVDKFNI